jgi:hypothetical protein
MRISKKSLFVSTFAIIGIIGLLWYRGTPFANVFIDSHDKEWRDPNNNTFNFIAEWLIDKIPRVTLSFKKIDTTFDIDNEEYLQSSLLYILFGLFIAIVFAVTSILILVLVHYFGFCGGRTIPRVGYSTFQIDATRGTILVFSFILEGMLIYGYFANSDLDLAMRTLLDRFGQYSDVVQDSFDIIINSLPDNMSSYYNKELFVKDLQYSKRTAKMQNEKTMGLFSSFESYRMVLIILGLIAATIACSVGIAAGAVHRSWPIMVMVIFSIVGAFILVFSFSLHFAGSKILREFCTDTGSYFDERNERFLPQRLQFFIQCVNSPLYSFISDYYIINAMLKTQDFASLLPASESKIPTYNNISDVYYQQLVKSEANPAKRANMQQKLNAAVNFSNSTQVVDRSMTCRWSREMYRNEQYLMCVYTADAIEMLMLSQGIAAFLMIIITFIAMSAIKKFKWAASVNMKSTFELNNGFAGRPARPKRKPGE